MIDAILWAIGAIFAVVVLWHIDEAESDSPIVAGEADWEYGEPVG